VLAFSLVGCEVTSEKIARWKQSDKGAAKIRAALRDTGQKLSIRAEAAEALGEMSLFEPLGEDLKAVTEQDRKQIMDELSKRLLAQMKGSNPKSTNKVQLQAKDTLFAIRGLAEEPIRRTLDDEVVRWILGDWGNRSSGEHSADKVVKTIGGRAASLIAEQIGGEPPLVVTFAILLREIGDQGARDLGAERLVELARRQTPVAEQTFLALGKVGSLKALAHLAGVAQKAPTDQRVWALQAMAHHPHPSVIPVAKGIASDASLKDDDARVRDEAFTLLEKIDDPQSLDALLGLLSSNEEKVRYRVVEAVVEGFKAKGLTKLLESLPPGYTYKKDDLKDFIEDDIAKLGASALPPLRQALASKSWIARLIAVHVLAQVGTSEDLAGLQKLTSDVTKLRGWDGATLGSEATAAVEKLKSRK
jgi:HEAT repeat protein